MSYKDTKRYLLGPDKFQKYVFRLVDKCLSHKNFFIYLFAVIFLVILGAIATNLVMSHTEKNFQKKISALDEKYDKFQSESFFKDDKKDENQTKSEETISTYAKKYEDLFLSKPSSSQGALVGLRAVKLYIEDKNYDAAVSLLDKILKKTKKSVFHQVESYFLMLSVLEEKKDYDLAISKIDSFLEKAPDSIKPVILYEQARFYSKKGDNDKAIEILSTVINKYSSSQYVSKAVALKSSIENKKVN